MNSLEERKFIILGIFLLIALIFVLRLFYIQVIDDKYTVSARNQTLQYVIQFPPRGIIRDRNGEIMVYNQAAYDLMVIPNQVRNIDTIPLCDLLKIDTSEFKARMDKAWDFSSRKPSVFEKLITSDEYSLISEKLYDFPGFFGENKMVRKYPQNTAAHVMGYISEVSPREIELNPYYKRGDYIGSSGVEKYYEKELRGKRGVKVFVKDVHNIIKGSYQEGKYDTSAVSGTNLESTIDLKLQSYGELLMQNKKGSIVAIQPSTGEILAMVSSPSYDPNLLVGRQRSANYLELSRNDSLNPLFNRALMAQYPPGSIFKLVQALVALEIGAIKPHNGFSCNKNKVGCHNHPRPSNLRKAIQFSCNPYFYYVFQDVVQSGKSKNIFKDSEMGLAAWKKHVESFGLGMTYPLDIPGMKSGSIPGPDLYDRLYGKGRWAFSTIYSLSIGQGEIQVTPIQMANLAAILANRGHFYFPHFVKKVGEEGKRSEFLQKHRTTVNEEHFEVVIDGMEKVVNEDGGTARRARIKDMIVCGKTGTAENPHGEDHSIFIAFAPKENPQIAIAVYIENAGFGGTWAAPIASLMMEKFIRDSIGNLAEEQRILNENLMNVKKKD